MQLRNCNLQTKTDNIHRRGRSCARPSEKFVGFLGGILELAPELLRSCLYVDKLRDRKGIPKNFATKISPNFRANFLVRFASKPLFYWVVPRIVQKLLWYCSCDSLGFVGSFLAPDKRNAASGNLLKVCCGAPGTSQELLQKSALRCIQLFWETDFKPLLVLARRRAVPVRISTGYPFGCGFFAYSWKLPAYSGAFLLTVDNFSLFTYSWTFFAYRFSFFAYSWSFLTYSGKCV